MGGNSGGGGSGGRSGGGGGGSGDAGQPGEVVRAAEEAKLQAKVNQMSSVLDRVGASVKSRGESISKLQTELSNINMKSFAQRQRIPDLKKSIRSEIKKQQTDIKRWENINKRIDKMVG